MDLTDSFTWEDLPIRDAETGHFTAAGWIPQITMYTGRAAIAIICFHTVQSTIRMVTNHETLFPVWYPFDWTVSPFYELVNISQVTNYKTESCFICSCSVLNLTELVDLLLFRFFFFLFCFFIYFPRRCSTTERWLLYWNTESGKNLNNTLLI